MSDEHGRGVWGGGAGRDLNVPLARPRMWWWPRVDVLLASMCVASCVGVALATHSGAYWLAALMAANWWLRTKWS